MGYMATLQGATKTYDIQNITFLLLFAKMVLFPWSNFLFESENLGNNEIQYKKIKKFGSQFDIQAILQILRKICSALKKWELK